MNLLSIQDALKNASDDQLVGMLQSPDASAPSYLVLTELKRRKDMRSKQEAQPQGTVAEDLARDSTYNNQGIRSLREPGYEEEEQEAEDSNEGIEAMREGGVVRMQEGGEIPLLGQEEYERISDYFRPRLFPRPYREPRPQPNVGGEGTSPEGTGQTTQVAPVEGGEIPLPPNPPAGGPPARQGQQGGGAATGGIGSLRSGLPTLAELQQQNVQLLPGLPQDLQERLRGMRTKPEDERNRALNLSLMEAGLRMMASRSPTFLGAVGEGAAPAVQSYGQQLGQIRKEQREDIKDELSVAQANLQRAYLAGQISASELRNRTALLVAEAQERGAAARAGAAERAAELRAQNAQQLAEQRHNAAMVQSAVTAAQRQMTDLGTVASVRSEILANRRRQNPNNTDTNVTNEEIQDTLVDRIIRGQNRVLDARRGAAGQGGGTANFRWDPNLGDLTQ